MNSTQARFTRPALSVAAGVLTLLSGTSAQAVTTEFGSVDAALETTITAGAAFRTGQRDNRLVGIGNGGSLYSTNSDDGNLAFDRGDPVSGGLKITSALSLGWGDFGLFVRGTAAHNAVIEDATLFDAADYGAGKEQPLSERASKTKAVRDENGTYVDLLDAYIYGSHIVFDRYLSYRIGRQAINWGESTLVQNGLNSLLALNANRLRFPGFEIEEVIVPAGAVWAAFDLIDNVSVEGFYQYEWERTVADASGTFFSTNDFAFDGGTQANIGFGRVGENEPSCAGGGAQPACNFVPFGSSVPRAATREASDSGQYGGALRIFVPALNDMDLGLYAANYHSRLPTFSGISRSSATAPTDTAAYFVEYPEDIQIYGLSFNTSVRALDIALQGEYSYKTGQPLQIDDVELLLAGLGEQSQLTPVPGAALGNQEIRGWRRYDVSQVDLSATKILGPRPGIGVDQITFLVEAAATQVHGLPTPDELRFEAPNTALPANQGVATRQAVPTETRDYASDFSWGYKAVARLTYNNVGGIINLTPTLLWQHDVDGITPAPIVNFVQDRRSMTMLLGWDYLNRWAGGVGWQRNFGGGDQNLTLDRDFVSMHVSYSF